MLILDQVTRTPPSIQLKVMILLSSSTRKTRIPNNKIGPKFSALQSNLDIIQKFLYLLQSLKEDKVEVAQSPHQKKEARRLGLLWLPQKKKAVQIMKWLMLFLESKKWMHLTGWIKQVLRHPISKWFRISSTFTSNGKSSQQVPVMKTFRVK